MIQKLSKLGILTLLVVVSLSVISQTTLTYSSGSWSPYAPNASTGSDNAVVDDINCNMPNGSVVNDLTVTALSLIHI